MIDEVFSIQSNTVHLEPDVIQKKPDQMPPGLKYFPMPLNNTRETFKACRDLSFSSVKTFMTD